MSEAEELSVMMQDALQKEKLAGTQEATANELHMEAQDLRDQAKRLRVAEVLTKADYYLGFRWVPDAVLMTGDRAGMLRLEAVGANVLNDALHDILRLGYHDEVELEPGVLLRVDDGDIRLHVDSAEILEDFVKRVSINVDWEAFHKIRGRFEQDAQRAVERRDLVNGMLGRLLEGGR